MSQLEIGGLAITGLLVLIYVGMPIGVSMLFVSFIGVSVIRGEVVSMRMLGAVANNSLREYLYAIVPLFLLMGLLVTISKVGKDTFDVFQKLIGRITAGVGIATVFANAVFAAITDVSIASATVFSRVAVPEMTRHGYAAKFATGVVAGSSVPGMLIPPSLLMIVDAVLAEESVGRMFLAGVGPGLLLAFAFSLTIFLFAWLKPDFDFTQEKPETHDEEIGWLVLFRKAVPIAFLMVLLLGGLYGGFPNPTEAGAAGTLGALLIALLRRSLTPRSLSETMLSGPIGPYGFLLLYLLLIIMLGCLIDSISIMMILLPIALPVAEAASFDLIWFGLLTVVAVEVDLLTPPFGLSVYIIKSAINDRSLKVSDIFRGALCFVGAMLVSLVLIIAFPAIATWLARI